MKINIKVIARAKQEKVEQISQDEFKVWVGAAREKGRANERVRDLLAEHFGKPKSAIIILRGQTASRKIIEII